MSVSWGVVPVVPEVYEWLAQLGYEANGTISRYPTVAELWQVLQSFDNLPVEKRYVNSKVGNQDLWELVLGIINSSQYAHMLGHVDENDHYRFHFWGSACREMTMVEILRRLAVICGPLIIFDDFSATPLLVRADLTDVDGAIQEWQERFAARNPLF